MLKWIAFSVPLAFGLNGCFTSSPKDTAVPQGPGTRDSLSAAYQLFDSSIALVKDGNTVVVQSTGVPNHKSPYFSTTDSRYEADTIASFKKNPNSIATQSLTFNIPLNPVVATSHSSTALGPIGVALNGVPLYNQYAGPNQPLTNEIYSFDQYNGHPQQSGQYHYHVEPKYLTSKSRAALIGFLLDGFPVYGPMENGQLVSDDSLDAAYHGHFGKTAEYPNGVYHYHITATAPYINGGQFYGTSGTVTQ